MKGYGGLVVYADDFVACFQYKEEAEEFYKHLKGRMEHFGMTLEESESSLIEFGRFVEERCKREGRKTGIFHFWVLHITVPVAGMVNSGWRGKPAGRNLRRNVKRCID